MRCCHMATLYVFVLHTSYNIIAYLGSDQAHGSGNADMRPNDTDIIIFDKPSNI